MKQFFRPVQDDIMETLAQYCGPDIKVTKYFSRLAMILKLDSSASY